MCSPRTIHLSQLASCHQGFQFLLSYWNDIPIWQILSLFAQCLLSTLFLEEGWIKTKLEIAISIHQLLQRYQLPYMIVLASVLTHTYALPCTNANNIHFLPHYYSYLSLDLMIIYAYICIHDFIYIYILTNIYHILQSLQISYFKILLLTVNVLQTSLMKRPFEYLVCT